MISLLSHGYTVPQIFKRFMDEDVEVTKQAIYNLVHKYLTKGTVISHSVTKLNEFNSVLRNSQ